MNKIKNLSKRGLALLISLMMCLSMLPVTALAADEHVIEIPLIGVEKGEVVAALNAEFGEAAGDWYYWYDGVKGYGSCWSKIEGQGQWTSKKPAMWDHMGLSSSVEFRVSTYSNGDDEKTITLKKVSKDTSKIEIAVPEEPIMLEYLGDLSGVNYEAVRAKILACVTTTPNGINEQLSILVAGKALGEQELKAGDHLVTISWEGNSKYWPPLPATKNLFSI